MADQDETLEDRLKHLAALEAALGRRPVEVPLVGAFQKGTLTIPAAKPVTLKLRGGEEHTLPGDPPLELVVKIAKLVCRWYWRLLPYRVRARIIVALLSKPRKPCRT